MNLHLREIHWIEQMQNALRSPPTDTFFIYCNYIDTVWFLIIFISTIMYLINKKVGISLLFIFIISGALNMLLKKYFHLPRPCQIDPAVGILCHASFGFPSGAAQTATIIAGVGLAKCPTWIGKTGALLFGALLCFSRIYLGLHFFTDILGGIGVGLGLLAIYLKLFPLIEKHWDKFALTLSVLLLIIGGLKMLPQAAMAFGVGIGLLCAKQTKPPTSWPIRIITLLIVMIGTSSLVYLGEIHPNIKPLATFLAGLFFIHLGSYLVEKIRAKFS